MNPTCEGANDKGWDRAEMQKEKIYSWEEGSFIAALKVIRLSEL